MSLDSRHPRYAHFIPDWQQMRDVYEGERTVKSKGVLYLPLTAGMIEDGAQVSSESEGGVAYRAYKLRARFPDFTREAVQALLGAMLHKPAVIELPPALEPMREQATTRGESLEVLLSRIYEQQLVTGRVGLLGDVFDTGEKTGQPYIALYFAEKIINWDEGTRDGLEAEKLNLVILDETEPERIAGFEWRDVQKFRVCTLGKADENEAAGTYRVGVFRDDGRGGFTFNEESMVDPAVRGRKAAEIPFVFVNTRDVVADPDNPPLLGLANLCLSIYRGDADYRQALFMQGQDTLVVIGGLLNETNPDKPARVGAGARLDVQLGGDAKYIGVDSQGLTEMREALTNDHKAAGELSGRLIETTSRAAESGDALQVRVAAKTVTLKQIATTGAFALQTMLRKLATWIGADPGAVKVTPNTEFVTDKLTAQELVQLMSGKSLGAPISLKTVHDNMQRRGMTQLNFEEELAQIEDEAGLELRPPIQKDPNKPDPNDPNADPNADDPNDPNADKPNSGGASGSGAAGQ